MLAHPAFARSHRYKEAVLASRGLVFYAPLEGRGDLRDIVGYSLGTIAGTVTTGIAVPPAGSAASVRFTGGASTSISGTNSSIPSGASADCSWACWVYCTATPATSVFAGFGTTGVPTNGSLRAIISNSGKIQLWGFNAPGDIITATDYDVNKPQLIVCTKTGSTTAAVYKNGVLIGSSSSLTFANATTDWWLAMKHTIGNETDNSQVSHFAIWNRALTAGEAGHLYAMGVS